jgi:hypothetical protein
MDKKNKHMRIFAIATDHSKTARKVGLYNDPMAAELNADEINPKIKEFWAKVRGVLGTVGVLGILTVVLGWAGVDTSVKEIEALLGAADGLVEAITLTISALALVIERASEAFKDK